MGRAFSRAERAGIIDGTFFDGAELRDPRIARTVARVVAAAPAAAGPRRDPNSAPVSAAARAMRPVCAWCYEPGDDRSPLVRQADHAERHPECQELLDQDAS